MSISPRQTDVLSATVWVIRRRRSYDYAKWLQLTSKIEHSHSQNYAAYSH